MNYPRRIQMQIYSYILVFIFKWGSALTALMLFLWWKRENDAVTTLNDHGLVWCSIFCNKVALDETKRMRECSRILWKQKKRPSKGGGRQVRLGGYSWFASSLRFGRPWRQIVCVCENANRHRLRTQTGEEMEERMSRLNSIVDWSMNYQMKHFVNLNVCHNGYVQLTQTINILFCATLQFLCQLQN